MKVIAFCGERQGLGVSTIAMAWVSSAVRQGKKVILVDLDLQGYGPSMVRPSKFGLSCLGRKHPSLDNISISETIVGGLKFLLVNSGFRSMYAFRAGERVSTAQGSAFLKILLESINERHPDAFVVIDGAFGTTFLTFELENKLVDVLVSVHGHRSPGFIFNFSHTDPLRKIQKIGVLGCVPPLGFNRRQQLEREAKESFGGEVFLVPYDPGIAMQGDIFVDLESIAWTEVRKSITEVVSAVDSALLNSDISSKKDSDSQSQKNES